MAIWGSCIPKYSLAIGVHVSLNARWGFGDILLLNRNDRVSSFYLTRGSKLCFLTYFSYFSWYFLILVFLQNCYFLAARESNFSSRFLIPLALQGSMAYVGSNISGTEHVGFLKQDAHRNLVAYSLPVIFPLSVFCRRFLVQTSIGQTQIIPFLLTKILKLNFLAWYKPRWVTQYS